MAGKGKDKDSSIEIQQLNTETIGLRLVGTTPMIYNAMSAKVSQDLLLPPKKKGRSEKESTLKHNPPEEYRRSVYRVRGDVAPTRLVFPCGAVKEAISSAALDIPGAAKAQIGRLCWVESETYQDGEVARHQNISVYGIPQLLMSVTRSADMNRTPDVRTRAILPEWAMYVEITFVKPNLNAQAVGNLMGAAGIIIGLSDWRQQKGSGNYGQFRLAGEDDQEFERIRASGTREAQDAALLNPTCYDVETEELLEWWKAETRRRGFEVA